MKIIQSIVLSVTLLAAAQFANGQTTFNNIPSRIVGQAVLQQQGTVTAVAPNLVEGREMWLPQGIVVDTSSSPSILYVADTNNNRVLAWKDASAFTKGDPATRAIGQRDLISVGAQGPGRDLTTGFFAPTGLAVDPKGNLYVVDSGNNRILRYPAPLSQTGDLLTVDLVIGQKDFSGRNANEGLSAPTEKTLAFTLSGSALLAGLAFDPQGNLWVSDPGNNRILRFPATALGTNPSNEPGADMVLGQPTFTSNTIPPNTQNTPSNQLKNTLVQPAGIAVDPKGRVFVADAFNRVVVYAPPFAFGQVITRIMGVVIPTKEMPVVPKVSESTLGAISSSGGPVPPNGVFFVGDRPFVVDTPNARILGYDPYDNWADENTAFSPPAKLVIGQNGFQGFQGNQGLTQPTNQTFAGPQVVGGVPGFGPISATFSGKDLFVADTGNNRVLVFPQRSGGTFDTATRLLGQIDFRYNSLNFVEGREVNLFQNVTTCSSTFASGGSSVVDYKSDPPHLYVSDPGNNRVLAYRDYRKVNAGVKADLVIGQPDLFTTMVNYPTNNPNSTTGQSLYSPEGLAVDANGDLYVADACNARVVRFPRPFDTPQGTMPTANLVLGQPGFGGQPIRDLSRQTMKSAYGVAFTFDGHLVVSDTLANRVLFFRKPAGGDFQSGAFADNVFGQPNFTTGTVGLLNAPRLMSLDPDDHLYVADTGNGRIAIFPNVPFAGDNPSLLSSITGLNQPYGVVVNQTTREIWVTNLVSGNSVVRYPRYESLVTNPASTAQFVSFGPVGVTLDPFGNPIVSEAFTNRVAFFFPAIDQTSAAGGVTNRFSGNAANYLARFAPGMLASIFPYKGSSFGSQVAQFSSVPIAATLGDVQVFVAGLPAPLLYVSPFQINLQIPGATPPNTIQEIQVVRASTSQVLASALFRFDVVSPGLFTSDASGSGQVSAVNIVDGQINSAAHPAKAGTYIELFGTGVGVVDNMPPDGQPAPSTSILPTRFLTRVIINGSYVPDNDVQFSGLAPGFVGLWQVNVKIPDTVPPGDVSVVVVLNSDVASSTDGSGLIRRTTIRVTP